MFYIMGIVSQKSTFIRRQKYPNIFCIILVMHPKTFLQSNIALGATVFHINMPKQKTPTSKNPSGRC